MNARLLLHSLQSLEEQGAYLVEQAAEPPRGIKALDEVRRELAREVVEGARAQGHELGVVAAKFIKQGRQLRKRRRC